MTGLIRGDMLYYSVFVFVLLLLTFCYCTPELPIADKLTDRNCKTLDNSCRCENGLNGKFSLADPKTAIKVI